MRINRDIHWYLDPLIRIVAILLLVYLAIYGVLVLRINLNWDEFNFLAMVYAIQEGRANPGLNNFHTVLYGWITAISGTEIDQIIVARITQLALLMASMIMLYLLARKMFCRSIALVLIFLTVSYTDILIHGFSFRYDTLCLFFSMIALYLYAARTGFFSAAIAGVSLGLSFLISIKTIFYAVAIGTMALYFIGFCRDRRNQSKRIAILGVSTMVCFAAIFLVRSTGHTGGISVSTAADAGVSALNVLQYTGSKMFLEEGFLPKWNYLSRSIAQNTSHWLLIGIGTIFALASIIVDQPSRSRSVLILICLLPLASVLIYRNAFPYFYVYVIPAAMLSAGLAIETIAKVIQRISKYGNTAVLFVSLTTGVVSSALFLIFEYSEGIGKQRQIINSIKEMFPEPVPYIDGYGMISSFPKVGLWMSTWGMENYHGRAKPIFEGILSSREPKFLLANHRALVSLDGAVKPVTPYSFLLPEDQQILREHFIDHWGPIRVAGRRISIDVADKKIEFRILISGSYTLEADHSVLINDALINPSDVIQLSQGNHNISAETLGTFTLRWGDNLVVPTQSPPIEWLFDGL